jgi:hypothetical protein
VSEDSLCERMIVEQCQLSICRNSPRLDGGKGSGQNPVDLFMSLYFATYVIRELLI